MLLSLLFAAASFPVELPASDAVAEGRPAFEYPEDAPAKRAIRPVKIRGPLWKPGLGTLIAGGSLMAVGLVIEAVVLFYTLLSIGAYVLTFGNASGPGLSYMQGLAISGFALLGAGAAGLITGGVMMGTSR